jgi:hypothetical protein
MQPRTWLRVTCLIAWLAGSGCTSLREIPRTEYAAAPERKNVRIVTQDGLEYEFDLVHVTPDSLYGQRRQDVDGPFDEFATMRMSLDDVTRMSTHGVDWYRTGLIGGLGLAALLAAGLSAAHNSNNSGGDSGGGGGGRVP